MSAKNLGPAVCLAILLACLLAPAPALAVPELDMQLVPAITPETEPKTHSDERMVYEITVQNTASANPVEGDELHCDGVPPSKSWGSATEFEIEWYRNGEAIPGTKGPASTADDYTLVAADAGKAIQCVVTGINPDAKVQLAEGVAAATSGSNVLTVRSRFGKGDLTAGSDTVTNAATSFGPFGPSFLAGQAITGTGIPAGTTITAVDTGAKTLHLSNAASASGTGVTIGAGAAPFAVGHLVFGPNGIQQGAEITAVSGQQVTISSPATGSFGAELIYATAKPPETTAAATSFASQPPVVVAPAPGTAPPAPISGTGRPGITPASGEDKRTCDASAMNLSGSPTFAYQWLRDGVEIAGATSPEYQPGPADVGSVLQCRVVASNAGGAMVGISFPSDSRVAGSPTGSNPEVEFSNNFSGPVNVETELPGGSETYALQVTGLGWNCTKEQPSETASASALCTRSDSLAPGASYPKIQLVERLGADAPDTLVTKAKASGGGAAQVVQREHDFTVGPADTFGFRAFEVEALDENGAEDTQKAGGHPFSVGAYLAFKEHVKAGENTAGVGGFRGVNGRVREVVTDVPRGLVGNPQAAPARCSSIAKAAEKPSGCPPGSVVGGIDVYTSIGIFEGVPIYAMEPEFGTPAEFGFAIAATGHTFALVPELDAANNYAIKLVSAPVAKTPELFEAIVDLCGYGGKLDVSGLGITEFKGCKKASEPGANPKPLITNPTRCEASGPLTRIAADSWEAPGAFATAEDTAPPLKDCEAVPFEPAIALTPTSGQADSPTGMDVELTMPTEGLEDPDGIAQANIANATVTLPEGMAVNPAMASGLSACSSAEIGLGNNDPATCPQSSKVGTVQVETPLLEQPLQGSVYVARQFQNPFNSLLALYMVLESERYGLVLKVAGRVDPDPVTGRLTTTFRQNPEAPFSKLSLHLPSGPRAPLVNPPLCGTYEIHAQISPWTAADPANPTPAETVASASAFEVGAGPNGGPCPSGGLAPKLKAGVSNPQAGATSPFVFELSREDGTQRFAGLEMTTPPGLSGYLKGIPRCPDAALAGIPAAAGTGAAQVAVPSCPLASQVGRVLVGAGAGPNPFYTDTGRAYLAGPYKGAPLSIAVVAPAVAGPFDLGNVVVRNALYVNPTTAQITVKSDPIPTILHGLLIDVRSTRVTVDRPDFILNPTNCEPLSIAATVRGEKGASAALTERFQVGGCERLKFKPKLKLNLKGGTKRGDYQRLTAVLTARPGDANIARTSVALPSSMFLAQEHIRTICTRVQFAADACPKGSVIGTATATTPLIAEQLTGTAYLRSSSNPLPDVVIALKGPESLPIEIELAGRIDSKNKGIRNTFDLVPDAPVTKFRLELHGGKKSLIVNSRDLCKGKQRATVKMTGQNGLRHDFRPVVGRKCGAKKGARAKR